MACYLPIKYSLTLPRNPLHRVSSCKVLGTNRYAVINISKPYGKSVCCYFAIFLMGQLY